MFERVAGQDHEDVHIVRDNRSGLSAIIAIHSTALGPAGGGCRAWHYESDEAALIDALRLSRGMSYKNAMAGLKMGGGKGVIALPADRQLSESMLQAFGEMVDSLNGRYITAEDVGMSEAKMQVIASRTQHVTGLPQAGDSAGGDPSPKTAFGVFCGIQAAVKFRFGDASLQAKRVAVQGVGNVGYYLCRHLAKAGAKLIVADIDSARTDRVKREFGAQVVGLDEILRQAVDVLAPCALGAILEPQSIAELNTEIIAGGANNQLRNDSDGQLLLERGILYAPDYVINAGGIISCACEYEGGISAEQVQAKVAAIGPRLTDVFEQAERQQRPGNEIADGMAQSLIADAS